MCIIAACMSALHESSVSEIAHTRPGPFALRSNLVLKSDPPPLVIHALPKATAGLTFPATRLKAVISSQRSMFHEASVIRVALTPIMENRPAGA